MKKQKNESERLIENLKKATNSMIMLSIFSLRPMNLDEIKRYLDEKSNSVCKVSYPYAAIYRMLDSGYIQSCGKKQERNQRRQEYYKITRKGEQHLQILESVDLQAAEQGDFSERSGKH